MKVKNCRLYGWGTTVMSVDELNEENAIMRMTNRPYRASRLLPVDDGRFVNERILEELEKSPLPKEAFYERFSDISYALKDIIRMEIERGNMESYTENGKEYFRITEKGRELVQFRIGRRFLRI